MDGFYGGMPLKVGGEERKREGGMENVFFLTKTVISQYATTTNALRRSPQSTATKVASM